MASVIVEDKFYAFLGVCILMGLFPRPEIRDYCTKGKFNFLPVSQVFPRERFEEILRSLHFAETPRDPETGERDEDKKLPAQG